MKKLFVVGVTVIMAIGFLARVAAEEFTIIGYGPGRFAVKGEIERQTLEMIKSWGERKPAMIVVQGFADKTGKAAENDVYASDRAREMKAFLETKTDAKITALSQGDSADARKVVVTVKFVTAPSSESWPIAQQQVSIFKVALILGATALFVLLLNILIDRLSGRKKTINQETFAVFETPSVLDEVNRIHDAERKPTKKWIEVDGYSVFIEYVAEAGRWYSPFTNASGGSIYEPTQTKIIGSVRRCLNNSKFSEQVKSLKETGLIRPL